MRLGGEDFDVERARRILLSVHLRDELLRHLPAPLSIREWKRIFTTEDDGALSNAYRMCQQRPGPTILLVMDSKGYTFGAFLSQPLQVQARLAYFGTDDAVQPLRSAACELPEACPGQTIGTGETFLFRAYPTVEVYRWSRVNSHYIMAARDSLGLGGGGMFGLWLDTNLAYGSSNTSSTFGNPCLASSEDFEIVAVEIWGFV